MFQLFLSGFIYPIAVIDVETEGFFEYYSRQVEFKGQIDLNGGYSWNLGKDYFEAKLDQTASSYVHSLYYFRRYNIHTGVLSEFVEEFDFPNAPTYKIEIVNPVDEGTATAIIIPIVSLVAIGMIYHKKRRKKHKS